MADRGRGDSDSANRIKQLKSQKPSEFGYTRGFERKLSRMGRRGFMKALTGIGVSASTAAIIPRKALANDPRSEVPYISRYEHTNHEEVEAGARPVREPVFSTMDRESWIRIEAANNAADKVMSYLEERIDMENIGVGVTTSEKPNNDEKQIVIKYNKNKVGWGENRRTVGPNVAIDKLRKVRPDTVTGKANNRSQADKSWEIKNIPVIVKEREIHEDNCHEDNYSDDFGDEIPGGCKISSSGIGTCATPVHDDNGGRGRMMLTCAHVVDTSNYNIYQPSGEKDGDVYHYIKTGYADFSTFEPVDGETYKHYLANNSGGYKNVVINGILTWSEIQLYEEEGWSLKKQGRSTGTEKGVVYHTEKDSDGHKRFWTEMDALGGDSGAPVYERYPEPGNDHISIAGEHVWSWNSNNQCPRDHAGACAIEHIEDYINVTV